MAHDNAQFIVILQDIRSAYNVGSFFRTCDGAGVKKIYLTGITPTPVDSFGRKNKEIAKTALGAEGVVSWEYAASISALVRKLKKDTWSLVAVEQDPRACVYSGYQYQKKTALIFGNEVEGVPNTLRTLCDACVHIPMHGTKESLNVVVAAGIILFDALRITTPSTQERMGPLK